MPSRDLPRLRSRVFLATLLSQQFTVISFLTFLAQFFFPRMTTRS
jgi:hypothetical protein